MRKTDKPWKPGRQTKKRQMCAALLAVLLVSLAGCGKTKDGLMITNVSYDPTREFYEKYNELFESYYQDTYGESVNIIQSHGGSGAQARSVVEGCNADVVTLALEHDITLIERTGLIDEGWINEFDRDSAPYTSTIVFLVRAGNPKQIADWDDLTADGVDVSTPDPKSSGGACWNYLAALAYAKTHDDTKEQQMDFLRKLYANVSVMDSGARGSTTTFVENGKGDVLIAWENEALTTLDSYPGEYELIYPSVSILAQPTVAVVDEVVDYRDTREVATEYLNYLYSDEAQEIEAENYFRPTNEKILKEHSDVFDLSVDLVNISEYGGWDEVQKKHFGDGGIFDEIYER